MLIYGLGLCGCCFWGIAGIALWGYMGFESLFPLYEGVSLNISVWISTSCPLLCLGVRGGGEFPLESLVYFERDFLLAL